MVTWLESFNNNKDTMEQVLSRCWAGAVHDRTINQDHAKYLNIYVDKKLSTSLWQNEGRWERRHFDVEFICLDGCGWCLVPPENKYLSRIKTLYLQIISHISYSLTVTLWLWHRGGLGCWDDHTLNIKSQYPNVVWLLWLARGGRWLRCNNGHIVAARYHLSTVAATGRVREWGLWWRHVTWSPSRHTRPHTGHRDTGTVSPARSHHRLGVPDPSLIKSSGDHNQRGGNFGSWAGGERWAAEGRSSVAPLLPE